MKISTLIPLLLLPARLALAGGGAADNLYCVHVDDSLAPAAVTDAATGADCRVLGGAVRACVSTGAAAGGDGGAAADDPLLFDRLCYKVSCASGKAAVPASPAPDPGGSAARGKPASDSKTVCTPASLTLPGQTRRRLGTAGAGSGDPTAANGDANLVAVGGCGDATQDGSLTASDALNTLKAAVGSKSCLICVCDVDKSGKITASDALLLLRFVVGQNVTLNCQADGNPIAWDGGGDGTSWTDPLNWSLDRIPNACDDATIQTGNTVVHPSGDNGVRSVTATSPLDLNGGTLTLRSTMNVSGLFRLRGATLAGANVVVPGNSAPFVLTSLGGTLKGATVATAMDLTANGAYAYVTDGLTLGGTAQLGANAGFFFLGSGDQMLGGTGTVAFVGGNSALYNYGGTTLHIGPGITVHGTGGTVGGAQLGSHMTIDGTVAADTAGTTYVGSYETWTNNGTLSATNSGTLTLQGPWTNSGTLMVGSGGTVNLGGVFTTAAIGTVSRSGGTINLVGEMKNTGSTLTLDAARGSWRFVNGRITGGTISEQDGSRLLYTPQGGILDTVTLATGADLTPNGAYAYVTGGLTLGGTAQIGPNAGFYFQGTGEQLLGGNGDIAFVGGNAQLYNYGNTTLHIGPDIAIHGPNGVVGGNQLSSRMTIDGTVTCDAPGAFYVGSYDIWTNNGTLAATGGGTLNLSGPWTNHGTVSVDAASTVNLGGTFSTGDIGTISRSGGTVNLTGQLSNTGQTLTLDGAKGDWRLLNGKITGGTIDAASGSKLVFTSSGGILDGVTLAGASDMSASGAYTYVNDGLTLNHDVSIGANGGFYFQGSGEQLLGGSGGITFVGGNAQIYNYGNTTLHIGAGITIHGPNGTVGGSQATSRMTLDGAVTSDAPGTLFVGSYDIWTNNGTLTATGGGTLTLQGPWTNSGTLSLAAASTLNLGGTFASSALGTVSRSGGTLNLTGQVNNSAATFTVNSTTGDMRLNNGKIVGGTVAQTGGAKLLFTSAGGTLDGVSIPGGGDFSAPGAYTYVMDGVTLGGTTTLGTNGGLYFLGSGTQNLAGTGTIVFSGGNSQVYNYGSSTLNIAPGITIHGMSGSVGSAQASTHLALQGTVTSDAAGSIDVGTVDTWTTTGLLNASAGNISTHGPWANDGSIHIGAGRALVAGSGFTQNSGGGLSIDIGGTATSAFGKVTVTGAAQLGGTLNIALANAFVPNLGDSFAIMTFTSGSGSFATVNGLAIDAGKKFSVSVTATGVTLTVVAA